VDDAARFAVRLDGLANLSAVKNQRNVKFLTATCGDESGQARLSVIVFLARRNRPHSLHDTMNVGIDRKDVMIQAVHHYAESGFRSHARETGEIVVYGFCG